MAGDLRSPALFVGHYLVVRTAPLTDATRRRIAVAQFVGEELLRSAWVRRLQGISFLGTLDHHPKSRLASTRWDHSMAVADLAVSAANDLELKPSDARHFVAACLLHDIGHYPLSHAAEPAFARRLGADHHRVSGWIIRGEGPLPRQRSLRPELERADLDPELIWSIIDRSCRVEPLQTLAALLTAPINLDTLEGITRVVKTFRLRRKSRLPRRLFRWAGTELALTASVIEHMDSFWGTKDYVYGRIINVPSNILAEARLCDAVTDAVDAEIFDDLLHFDDAALVQRLRRRLGRAWPGLGLDHSDDKNYELRGHAGFGHVLTRKRKRYCIEPSVEPSAEGLALPQWPQRYQYRREPAYLISRRRQLELPGLRTIELDAPEI